MERIRYHIAEHVAVVSMDDGKANAMSVPFFEEFGAILDRAEQDETALLVFTGRPGMFSGGLDIKLLPTLSADGLRDLSRALARTMLRVWTLPFPTVAAIGGHAIAGGAMLSFACDRRFGVDGPYRIQMNETAIGIALPAWMFTIASSAVPSRSRVEALLHAHAYTPQEAYDRGILDGVAPEGGDVVEYAKSNSADLLGLDAGAYAESKRRLRAPEVEVAFARLEEELA